MKHFIITLLFLSLLTSCSSTNSNRKLASVAVDNLFGCKEVGAINKSKRLDCKIEGEKGEKTFHALILNGSYPEIAHDHGYLLALEMQDGVLRETAEGYARALADSSPFEQEIIKKLQACFTTQLKESVSKEFSTGGNRLYEGMVKNLAERKHVVKYSKADFEMAYYGIELSNIITSLEWQMSYRKVKALGSVFSNCGISLTKGVVAGLGKAISKQSSKQMKMGCIGSVTPANYTKDGFLIHARNLDSHNLEGWNKSPAIFLVHEPGYYKYVSAGTAGLAYSGGISGFNEKGISVSLHQMDAVHFDPNRQRKTAEMMPFLQQRILRETATIDEAIEIIKKVKRFAAWTILISDANKNESASIEISARKFEVARRRLGTPMGQGNHFDGQTMAKEYFQPRYGHTLESLSRLLGIEEEMSKNKGKIDLGWVISKHASHNDYYTGRQSFGRTPVKAINVMSTFSIPLKQEFWVTLGDFQPAVHGKILGFNIDFNSMKLTPLGIHRDKSLDDSPNWRLSFEEYVNAYLAYDKGETDKSLSYLNHAIELAEMDKFFDSSYHLVRARVNHKTGNYSAAFSDLEKIWNKRDSLLPYNQAIIAMLSVTSSDMLENNTMRLSDISRSERLKFAKDTFSSLKYELVVKEPVRGSNIGEKDLNKKLGIVESLINFKTPKLQSIGFVLAE